jgi:hypothetical protein
MIISSEHFKKRLNIVVGAYGSGKTEICVNLAINLAEQGKKVNLADLDIANPYFRTREARDILKRAGVNPVVPSGEIQFSDLPVILPQIQGMIRPSGEDYSFFDVGGDETGARVLASLEDSLQDTPAELFQVINTNRPFTDTVQGCIAMKQRLEQTGKLKISAFIINTHLMEFTDESVIMAGYAAAKELEEASGIRVAFFSVMEGVMNLDKLLLQINYPLLILKRRMLPTWLKKNGAASWPVTDE